MEWLKVKQHKPCRSGKERADFMKIRITSHTSLNFVAMLREADGAETGFASENPGTQASSARLRFAIMHGTGHQAETLRLHRSEVYKDEYTITVASPYYGGQSRSKIVD